MKLNSIKDKQKKILLKKEKKTYSNSQYHQKWKNNNIKYALEDLKRNENDTMKMYEVFKNIKRLASKENLIVKTKEGLTSWNHNKIFRKLFLYKHNTNAKRMSNTNINTIHIIRDKKSSMDSKK